MTNKNMLCRIITDGKRFRAQSKRRMGWDDHYARGDQYFKAYAAPLDFASYAAAEKFLQFCYGSSLEIVRTWRPA
jgi:hypothetical protein